MSVVKPAVSAEALAYLEKQKSLNFMKASETQEFVQTSSASSRLPVPESSTLWALVVGGGLVLAIATFAHVQDRRRVLSQRILIEPEGRSVFNEAVMAGVVVVMVVMAVVVTNYLRAVRGNQCVTKNA